ncbi:MAG: YhfC family intramembrane metalloprotease [Clostridia bacterium]|jgi:uncharacterized membrane protein YhfC|nr:YhfC family intramembrane metalloprotease [Clostridia bacterium]MBQ1553856.1 YhfC family intramembrane metalloprotease [Clostridia bacterium]MBQ4397551.1 YhfC family intramembrane metalloprotease [Clostridia bacterium]
MMFQVSTGALVALIFIMLVCFVLPVVLYTAFYRLSDSTLRMFLIGAGAFFTVKFVAELPVNAILEHYWPLASHPWVQGAYLMAFCPLAFVGINYAALRIFGKDIRVTGHVLMTATGYTALQNIVEAGAVSAMYFITLWDIRFSRTVYTVVSDADYISMTDVVSQSSLLTETIYDEMQTLCDTPAMYFVSMCLERLWLVAVYSAVILVIWLAVRKSASAAKTWLLLAVALGMRCLAALPNMLAVLGILTPGAGSALVIASILAADAAASVVCWRKLTDE